VAGALRSRGLEEFVPTYSGRGRLFPGIVFCRLYDENRRDALEIPGVLSIVGPPESGRPIADAEIAGIKMILASRLPVKSRTFLRAGQRVWIRSGPLAGLEVVGVEALERSVAVEINYEMVCARAACGGRGSMARTFGARAGQRRTGRTGEVDNFRLSPCSVNAHEAV
jgi:hypothetical protein